jgi:hypothetical protein
MWDRTSFQKLEYLEGDVWKIKSDYTLNEWISVDEIYQPEYYEEINTILTELYGIKNKGYRMMITSRLFNRLNSEIDKHYI